MIGRGMTVAGLVLLAGCVSQPSEHVGPARHAAAVCLRDVLAASPAISNMQIAERPSIRDRHVLDLVVEFTVAQGGGRAEQAELLVFANTIKPGEPPFYFSNWRLVDFPEGMDKALAARCPMVPDRTPVV